ncbi:MAG: ATP-binding domain-containing protein, partial [Nitrosomonadales bacterium]|nr:ATP-binding domain-containing protein [Nitrosomonadales bacterium]
TSLESGELQASAGDDALQLMTIHSSKGLEFDTVFITGLEEGLCPHERSLSENNGLEEERRLMYVAVTRARKKLYLTLAQSRLTYGQIMYNLPSRFLDEIPNELIKRINAPKKVFAFSSPKIAVHSESKHTWKIGAAVEHAKFGVGIVTGYEGNENDLRVQINFHSHGVKWLAMEYAKLVEI